ncbi:MAG: heavy-metal-associated domain-containing protein [Chitinophagaceae bacterium]
MKTTETIFVENIKCGGCMKSIKDALLQIGNVEIVIVDKDKESVIVTGTDIKRDSIINKLGAIGYPEKGNNSLLKKARSFVSCAIGKMN